MSLPIGRGQHFACLLEGLAEPRVVGSGGVEAEAEPYPVALGVHEKLLGEGAELFLRADVGQEDNHLIGGDGAAGCIDALRFHLERQTGGISRDIERGSRSISSLINYALYSILPTLIEITLVLGILFFKYDTGFVVITVLSLGAYIVFTIRVSNWRREKPSERAASVCPLGNAKTPARNTSAIVAPEQRPMGITSFQ
mgnify:CR=1 FL=1